MTYRYVKFIPSIDAEQHDVRGESNATFFQSSGCVQHSLSRGGRPAGRRRGPDLPGDLLRQTRAVRMPGQAGILRLRAGALHQNGCSRRPVRWTLRTAQIVH